MQRAGHVTHPGHSTIPCLCCNKRRLHVLHMYYATHGVQKLNCKTGIYNLLPNTEIK